MAHVKRGVTAHARHKKILALAKGYRGRANTSLPHRRREGREGAALRLSRPAQQEAQFPRPVDPAHQRRRARARADLLPVHPRPEARRHRARPQGAGRSRHARARGLQGDRGAGAGGAGPRPSRPSAQAAQSLKLGSAPSARVRDLVPRWRVSDHIRDELFEAHQGGGVASTALEQIAACGSLGRNGQLTGLMKGLGALKPEERKARGADLNALKDEIEAALARGAEASILRRARNPARRRDARRDPAGRCRSGGPHPSRSARPSTN